MPPFDHLPLHDFPDRAIRKLLEHPANLRELVEAVDPDLASQLDFDRAARVDRSFLLDDWRRRESDLLVEVPLTSMFEGRTVLVCVLVEHQSSEDPRLPLRILIYASLYWEREWKRWEMGHEEGAPFRITPIVPIVFHTGQRPWKAARTLADLMGGPDEFRAYAPMWRLLFWDLAEHTADELKAATGAWLRTLAVVRAEREDREPFYPILMEVLRRLDVLVGKEEIRRHDLLWFVLSWIWLRRPRDEREGLLGIVRALETDEARRREVDEMSQTIWRTWADDMRDQLREEVRAEIEAQIKAETEARVKAETEARVKAETEARVKAETEARVKIDSILRMLHARFGNVPEDVRTAIGRIHGEERLNELLDDVVLCDSLAAFRSRVVA